MLKHRAVVVGDKIQLAEFIREDSDHREKCTADFWMPNGKNLCLAFEDEQGVVFFLRLEKCLRVHAQFGQDKMRTARALIELNGWLDKEAKQHGYVQVIWDSISDGLIKFAERFGYRRSAVEIIKDIQ